MNYQIMPMGKVWESGMFSVPTIIANNYIKLASEYQLKALLLILSNGGNADSKQIAKVLGCTESDADDFLEFWVDEGVLIRNSEISEQHITQPEEAKAPEKEEKKEKLPSVPVPALNKQDIAQAMAENEGINALLQSAQEVFGGTISHSVQSAAVNMVQYYGLPWEIALTILQFYENERKKGKALGIAYVMAMAKNWSEEGITTLEAADEKLRYIENTNKLWKEILSLSSLHYRNPTPKQRTMVKQWEEDFSFEVIAYACETMCETAEKPSINYLEGILKRWKKDGIKTVEEAKASKENHQKKTTGKTQKLQGKPSFDISEIERKALLEDDYDI